VHVRRPRALLYSAAAAGTPSRTVTLNNNCLFYAVGAKTLSAFFILLLKDPIL